MNRIGLSDRDTISPTRTHLETSGPVRFGTPCQRDLGQNVKFFVILDTSGTDVQRSTDSRVGVVRIICFFLSVCRGFTRHCLGLPQQSEDGQADRFPVCSSKKSKQTLRPSFTFTFSAFGRRLHPKRILNDDINLAVVGLEQAPFWSLVQ